MPKILYHASPRRDLEEIRPGNKTHRDPKEGPQIFAAPNPAIASMFMFESDGSWALSGKHNGVPYVVIHGDREEFMKRDRGGIIYELPNDGFSCDLTKGLGKDEWTCSNNVRPSGKKEYASALDAMLESGVQVYFVDQQTFNDMKSDEKEHGFGIIKTLTSENQRKGKNVVLFESK